MPPLFLQKGAKHMQTYDINVIRDGEEITAKLRLTLAGQLSLQRRFKNQSTAEILLTAIDSPERIAAVLGEALAFKGNDNIVTDGAELYDLLVDSGVRGEVGFAEIMTELGRESGIFADAVADGVKLMTRKTVEDSLKRLQGIEPDPVPEEEDPAKN